MANSYFHSCPYCGTALSIAHLPVEKKVGRCPNCKKPIIVDNFGKESRKPNIYICPKCNQEHIYDGRPPVLRCEKCGNTYLTSTHGVGMIELGVLSRGDNGALPYNKKRDNYTYVINKWLSLSKKVRGGIIAIVVACVATIAGAYIHSLPPAIDTSMAYANMDSLWTEFSEKNPYNIQLEFIKSYSDNSKVVIISEPSDFVSEEELNNFFKPYNSYSKTYKRRIGFDGWMRDFVVAFNDLDDRNYDSFIKDLAKLLYKTDYKASIIDISTMLEHTPYLNNDLNYNITSEELKEWFIDSSETIIPLEGDAGDSTTIVSILDSNIDNGMQLYTTASPGFVFWAIDKSKRPNELTYRINARKFSLDSDLILGAISKNNNVIIIARERCVPVTQLPPMRSETLCLLSYTNEDELSQSYERNNIFAGKQIDSLGGKDFAPILLSDALWHTEYGSILNVTDQMLKSWSENGSIDYIDFNYTKPVYWGFDKGVMNDLGVSLLTYNWNTEGVGYIVEDSIYSIYALNRTGSLPVSYIPGDATAATEKDPTYHAEQNAYNFFSSLSNPELVKVVQYAAMYQIFQNFAIHMRYDHTPSYDNHKFVVPNELECEAANILRKLGNYTSNDRGAIAAFYNASITTFTEIGLPIDDKYRIISNNKDLPTDPFAIFLSIYIAEDLDSATYMDLRKLEYAQDLILQIDTLHECISPIVNDNMFIESLSKAMIDRNKINDVTYSTKSKDEEIAKAYYAVFEKQQYIKAFAEIFSAYNHNQAKNLMVATNAERNRTWIKTPTIVESWSLVDSINQEGGHNLNSKVTRFRVADDLKPGQTREVTIGNKKIIEVSRTDSRSHIIDQSYLRRVGRLEDPTIKGKAVKTRPQNIVTDLASKRTHRGFNSTDHCITIGKESFTLSGKKYQRLDELLWDLGSKNTPNEVIYIQINTGEGAGVTPSMVIQYMDNFYRGNLHRGNTMLPISKYDFSHATQIKDGDNITFVIPIKPGVMNMGGTSTVNVAGLGGSSNMGTRMHIIDGTYSFKIVDNGNKHQVINLLKQFFKNTKGYFNEFKLKMLFKQNGIEIHEPTLNIKGNKVEQQNLMIAFYKNKYIYDIQFSQKEIA